MGALGGAAVIAAAVELGAGLGAGLDTAVAAGGGEPAQATTKRDKSERPKRSMMPPMAGRPARTRPMAS